MSALDMETMNTKEFDKYSDYNNITEAKDFIQKSTADLEQAYSDYHVELKRGMEALKRDNEQYQEDCADIKAIKRAERDRIKPEKNLFDLALLCLESAKSGDDGLTPDSPQFKKCIKSSGPEYTKEFIGKSDSELRDYCIRFHLLQRQVAAELAANEPYQAATRRKKAAEDEVKANLYGEELLAKLAMVELKNRRDIEEED